MESLAILVIPCYHEATRLPVSAFKAFACTRHAVRFLFVDDGSTDRTWQVLQGLRQDDPQHVAICHLAENRGKAEAVRQGILRAFEASPAYVGYWDADLATPLDTLLVFWELLTIRPDLAMVFGARVQLLGHVIERRAGARGGPLGQPPPWALREAQPRHRPPPAGAAPGAPVRSVVALL